MNRAVLMSIQPQHACNILNRKKTIEIRKRFPKDFRGWVYMYITKGELLWSFNRNRAFVLDRRYNRVIDNPERIWQVNGKVIARFYVDNVEEIINLGGQNIFETQTLDCIELLEKSCLLKEDLDKYLIKKYEDPKGYAIHISQLEIFDRPKALNEFSYYNKGNANMRYVVDKAPQSWQWIDMGE